ncbi:transposase [Streptomyces sp. A1-5]|nr:transposase [Streptomyces noursei]UJB40268.1 transposase [Streptomyces sp. A1-5]
MHARAQLADAEREFIEPCLPIGEYGPQPVRLRQQFEGVPWRFRAGEQWRELPAARSTSPPSAGAVHWRAP